MKTPNYVLSTLLAAFCVGYYSPSLSQQAPGAYQAPDPQAPGAFHPQQAPGTFHPQQAPGTFHPRQAPRAYHPRQAPGGYNVWDPTPRGTSCGENGLYSNGMGTCCSRIQT